jgi:hypothetical protein
MPMSCTLCGGIGEDILCYRCLQRTCHSCNKPITKKKDGKLDRKLFKDSFCPLRYATTEVKKSYEPILYCLECAKVALEKKWNVMRGQVYLYDNNDAYKFVMDLQWGVDVTNIVFSYLSIPLGIPNLSLVCKAWNHFLHSKYFVWTSLTVYLYQTTEYRLNQYFEKLMIHCRQSIQHIRYITMAKDEKPTNMLLLYLLSLGQNIKSMILNYQRYNHLPFFNNYILPILKQRKDNYLRFNDLNIQDLQTKDYRDRSLALVTKIQGNNNFKRCLTKQWDNLTSLCLIYRTTTTLSAQNLEAIAHSAPNLIHLKLVGFHTTIENIYNMYPQLESLTLLSENKNLNAENLYMLTKLKKLRLHLFYPEICKCTQLEQLRLDDTTSLEAMTEILKLPNLRKLTIPRFTQVSEMDLRALLNDYLSRGCVIQHTAVPDVKVQTNMLIYVN